MTVKELIEKLKEMPEDMRVMIHIEGDYPAYAEEAEINMHFDTKVFWICANNIIL